MNRRWLGWLVPAALLLTPALALARGLGVEVWTNRGDDAVYQPGEKMDVKVRASDDAYLLVYEIDAEGYVRLLFPYRGSSGYVEGRATYRVPPDQANVDLVVQQSVGQCYIVALASADRFQELPWYLRPYDMQAEQVGYEGMRDDEEGITAEGRIVGDPFVAMERIRRRVLDDPEDGELFGSSYTSYYVHDQVRYPRYLCYDCHRPGRWSWWPGFDPYYTSCSVFDFRVNYRWGWGPSYWFGSVPYYFYVPRSDCPPRYRTIYQDRSCFSSWDGWRRWNSMWGNHLVRYKTPPPAGYVAPPRFRNGDGGAGKGGGPAPPGFIAGGNGGLRPVVGRNIGEWRGENGGRGNTGRGNDRGKGGSNDIQRPPVDRSPGRESPRGDEGGRLPRGSDLRDGQRPTPRIEVVRPRDDRPRDERPAYTPPGRIDRPRYEPPPRDTDRAPRNEPRREVQREEPPRERSHRDPPKDPPPADRKDPPSSDRKDPPPSEHRDNGQRGGGRTKG